MASQASKAIKVCTGVALIQQRDAIQTAKRRDVERQAFYRGSAHPPDAHWLSYSNSALIGKWHLGYLPHYSPLKRGYDEFFGVMGGFTGYCTHVGDGGEHDLYEGEIPIERAGYITDIVSERAVSWIATASAQPEPRKDPNRCRPRNTMSRRETGAAGHGEGQLFWRTDVG